MSFKSVVNQVGNIYNTIADLAPKQFYSSRDFYNFIRKAQNAPVQRTHFTVVPKLQLKNIYGQVPNAWYNIFTDTNIAKFAICVQRIGDFTMKMATTPPALTGPKGDYSILGNKMGCNSGNIKITFLQTAQPIIQGFIIPWMYQCMRSSYTTGKIQRQKDMSMNLTNLVSTVANMIKDDKKKKTEDFNDAEFGKPTMVMDIKYYRPDQIAGVEFLMNSTFIYRFKGLYPVSISGPNAQHKSQTITRSVTFNYNSCVCLPDPAWGQKLFGTNSGFAYSSTQSPVQILNSLNSVFAGVKSI